MVLVLKILPASAGDIRDVGSIPGLERPPEGGNDKQLQYSCLENLHRQRSLVGKDFSQTQLKQICTHAEILWGRISSNRQWLVKSIKY